MPLGRPTKLTPEIQERICAAIQQGNYAFVAARCAGISESTFYSWLDRGAREKRGAFAEFLESIKKAESIAEAGAIEVVRNASQQSWQAAAWWLERKYPERWARKERVDYRTLTNEQLEALASEESVQ